jgi:hypothetical protein
LEVSPVDGSTRSSHLLLKFGRGDASEDLPAPRAYLCGGGRRAQASYRFGEAELSKRLLGIGGEQQASADLS